MDTVIVGLGGVGSVIALRLGTARKLILIDHDKYEDRNAHRQPLARLYKSVNKAEAHANELARISEHDHDKQKEALDGDSILPPCSLVIAAVDNKIGRNWARRHAMKRGVPLIIAANEQFDGEASLLMPEWQDTPLDPWVTWPELWEDTEKTANHIHCTDPRIAVEEPQTPLSNFMAASGAIWLAELLAIKGSVDLYDPIRFSFTANCVKSKKPFDIIGEEAWNKMKK